SRMPATLLLHVRELPSGRVVVTPVEFPDLSLDADSYDAAVATLRPRLEAQLAGYQGSMRSLVVAPDPAQLDAIEIDVDTDEAGAVPITVALVTIVRETTKGRLHVVRAPE